MAESREVTQWKQSWAPAYSWESLVGIRQFRLDAVSSFFQPTITRSNVTEMFSSSDPRSGFCVFCSSKQYHDCLFFGPQLASILIDIIEALGKTKLGSTIYVNADVVDRVISRLPSLYEQLGHPTNNGFVWRCVHEKLHMMFPGGVLMMEDIRTTLQNEYVATDLHLRREHKALTLSDILQDVEVGFLVPAELTTTIIDPELDPLIMCGCDIYSEGSCHFYNQYIGAKSLCLSSHSFLEYTNCQISLDDYINAARLEVESDWGLSPVCAHFRINMFLGVLQRKLYLDHTVNEEKRVVVRINRAVKFKSKRRKQL